MTLRKIASAVALLGASVAVQAAPIVVTIDDFNGPDMEIYSFSGPLTKTDAVRTATLQMNSGSPSLPGSVVQIGSITDPAGLLQISNGENRDSTVTLQWTMAPLTLPTDAYGVSLYFLVHQSDANATELNLTLGNVALDTRVIAGNTKQQPVTFALSGSELAAFQQGGVLKMKIDGATGWDMSLDNFGVSYNVPVQEVPEPGSLALIGLALAGLGVARRARG